MGDLATAFRQFADVLESLEAAPAESESFTISTLNVEGPDDPAVAFAMEVALPTVLDDVKAELTAEAVSLTTEGALEVEFQLTPASTATDAGTARESMAATRATDLDCPATAPGADSSPDPASDHTATRPAYRDPDRLQEVYDAHETFAEMTAALDVDVVPQTVRRYMIKYGIHDPASTHEPSTGPPVATDGHGTTAGTHHEADAAPIPDPPTGGDPSRCPDSDHPVTVGAPDADEPTASPSTRDGHEDVDDRREIDRLRELAIDQINRRIHTGTPSS